MSNNIHTRSPGFFSELELSYCRFVQELQPGAGDGLLLAVALVVRGSRQGEVCLLLDQLAGAGTAVLSGSDGDDPGVAVGELPSLAGWINELRHSSVVGEPGEFKPFILDAANRFYLYRHWENEQRLAALLTGRLRLPSTSQDLHRLATGISRVFPDTERDPTVVDWQKVAAVTGLLRDFCVITGGPGTGKTFTVVKLVALLQEIASPQYLHIGLTAPTGKSAVRLSEAITAIKQQIELDPEVMAQIPEKAMTIHRLLGSRADSPQCRYGPDNQLPLDVLIVDEASMVDQTLMCKLLEAISPRCRLVLLGDKNQLASVEPGRVLGDICAGIRRNRFSAFFAQQLRQVGVSLGETVRDSGVSDLEDRVVLLEKSFRFDDTSAIAALAAAVEGGRQHEAVSLLTDGRSEEVRWHDWPAKGSVPRLSGLLATHYQQYLRAATPGGALAAFERFRLLCVHRRGRQGVATVNAWVEDMLVEAGLISKTSAWYRGRPVMVTRNNYGLDLYNGDIGIALPDAGGELKVYFATADGGCRALSPSRLADYETTYAMTVHKSQGSEYEHVALLLPEEPSPALSRELLYTAITRARKGFSLWGDRQVLATAFADRPRRISGLGEMLWPEGDAGHSSKEPR